MHSPYWTVPCHVKICSTHLGKSSPSRQKLNGWKQTTEGKDLSIGPYQANPANSAQPKIKAHHASSLPNLPYQKHPKNNCQISHMHLVLTGNREVGVPSPGANLVPSSWKNANPWICNSPLRWCGLHWSNVKLRFCFRMNRRKTRKWLLFSNGILRLHDYNIMESLKTLACGWFHL